MCNVGEMAGGQWMRSGISKSTVYCTVNSRGRGSGGDCGWVEESSCLIHACDSFWGRRGEGTRRE
jgi:hypothetical protein